MRTAALVSAFLICICANAQEFRSTLDGRITDAVGAAVSGAKVEIKNADTGESIVTVSNDDGAYRAAFLIPGGFGTRQELNNGRLHTFIRALPDKTLLVSVCTGSWIYGRMGLLDGRMATNRKEPDRLESSNMGKVPIDRLAQIAPACRISRARVVDSGRIITGGGIASGMEVGFHLLRRAGYGEDFITEVARIMEYAAAYEIYRGDIAYDQRAA